MSLLSQFYLSSAPSIVQLDTLEITHPNFTQIYRLVRNAPAGLDAFVEGPSGPFHFDYYPMEITPIGSGSDLAQSLQVTLGDLGNVIQKEIQAITEANKMDIRPVAVFRTFRSDVLTSGPMFGPLTLEISKVTCSSEGNSFECHAPRVNNSRTGELYTIEQFPMLAGFFK